MAHKPESTDADLQSKTEAEVQRVLAEGRQQADALSGSVDNLDAMFGQRVREVRESKGLSQAALAGRLRDFYGVNWHQTTVAKVEAGERPAKLTEAVAVGSVLGVPLDSLLRPEGVDAPAETARMAAIAMLDELEGVIRERRRQVTQTARARIARPEGD